jgi:signal transduction histidine kinase
VTNPQQDQGWRESDIILLPGSPQPLGFELLILWFFAFFYAFLHVGGDVLQMPWGDPKRVQILFTTFLLANALAVYLAYLGLRFIPARGMIYDANVMLLLALGCSAAANSCDLFFWISGFVPMKASPVANGLFLVAMVFGTISMMKLAILCHVRVGARAAVIFLITSMVFLWITMKINPQLIQMDLGQVANPKEALFGVLYTLGNALIAALALQIILETQGKLFLAMRFIGVGTICLSFGSSIYGVLFTLHDSLTVSGNPVHLILGIGYLCIGLGTYRLGHVAMEILTPDLDVIPPSQPLIDMFGPSLGLKVYEAMIQRIKESQAALDKVEAETKVQSASIRILEEEIAIRKKTEEELRSAKENAEAANQAKSQFLAMMSHELRTPLTSIRAYSQLIADPETPVGKGVDDQTREYSGRIFQSALHLQEMIDGILHFSRIESGKLNLRYEEFTLDDILMAIQAQAEFLKRDRKVLFSIRKPEIPVYLKSDFQAMKLVLSNLIGNAFKFTPSGEIRLDIRAVQTTLEIEVEDTGIGIPADHIDRVFEPFFQVSMGITRKFGGTGLGLSIVKRLLEEIGGSIHIASEVRKGTKISVKLFGVVIDPPLPNNLGDSIREALSRG